METFHQWVQEGRLVKAAYVKHAFELSLQHEQASLLTLKDISRHLLVTTATRASDGLIHNRKGVLAYERVDRSAEQLAAALAQHAPWWPSDQVAYMPPKDMTGQQLHILITAMVSRGYEAQQKLLGIIKSSWQDYPNMADYQTVLAVLQRMVQDDWASGKGHG